MMDVAWHENDVTRVFAAFGKLKRPDQTDKVMSFVDSMLEFPL